MNAQYPRSPEASRRFRCVRLILGDQLNAAHSWYEKIEDDVLYVMMEIRRESEYVTHHIQKIVGIFAAMRGFARELSAKGFALHYLGILDEDNEHDFVANLKRLKQTYCFERIEYQSPDEYRLDLLFQGFASTLDCSVQSYDTEHFLSSREEVREFFAGKKTWRMENFYRRMRIRHRILVDANHKPAGDRWNYDQENRKKLPRGHRPPLPRLMHNDLRVLGQEIEQADLPSVGTIDAGAFIWPINRSQALELLEDFISRLLPYFGLYQDALSDDHWSLYHSRISQAMNLKLISPREVIDRAIDAHKQDPEKIDLPQIEGFVRQILGWREYVRGIYWSQMPKYRALNVLDHQRPLPSYFWNGKTKMRCVQRAVEQSLERGYAHHIQRLMITGNFCALAGIDPDEVDRWYLGIYVDAFEWVELPNTRGMSQFADGGLLASKPYVSSANYIHKMGDHCRNCHYDRRERLGDNACPFNSLYWRFLTQHAGRLRSNPRMSMMYRQLDKLADQDKVLARAEECLAGIEAL